MQHISNLLKKQIKESGLSQNVQTALVVEEFEKILQEIFGQFILKKVKPLFIKNKIITLACLSSVVSQDVNLRKDEIIRKVNNKFKTEVITNIKFRI